MAGLTAAAYVAREGRSVVLVEKNERCGGLVGTFSRNGFLFDTGIRALEDAGIIRPMLRDLGIELEFVDSPVSVGVEQEIIDIESAASLETYREMLTKLYPESEEEIRRIIGVVRKVMKEMEVLYGVENPVFRNPGADPAYVLRVLIPWLPRFLFTVRRINRMAYPVEQFLERATRNRSLRDIIGQGFFKGTPTFFAMSYFSLYLDYIYPKPGTGALPSALERKVTGCGGRIVTGAEITEVVASENVARDGRGSSYHYRSLVWAADLKRLYAITGTEGLTAEETRKIVSRTREIEDRRGGDSVFVLSLTVDEPPESFARVAHGHFLYTPSRQGLGEVDRREVRELVRNREHVSKPELLSWLDRFCRLTTYEISIPALRNPAAAPEGKTGLVVSVLFPYDLVKKVDESGWYEEFRSEVEDRMVEVLSDSVYPMLKGSVISQFSSTPLDIERRAGSSDGAITGWSFEEPSPAVNRMQNVARSVLTPIRHVYQAGQWTYSPAGLPMSILTGKLAADRALKECRRR